MLPTATHCLPNIIRGRETHRPDGLTFLITQHNVAMPANDCEVLDTMISTLGDWHNVVSLRTVRLVSLIVVEHHVAAGAPFDAFTAGTVDHQVPVAAVLAWPAGSSVAAGRAGPSAGAGGHFRSSPHVRSVSAKEKLTGLSPSPTEGLA